MIEKKREIKEIEERLWVWDNFPIQSGESIESARILREKLKVLKGEVREE